MSCANYDWKAFVLNELPAEDRRQHEQHLTSCAECRHEQEGLKVTTVLLARIPQAEPPRRIAFVSDPVLEPKWWQKLLMPGPRWAFASSIVLAAAILAHGYIVRPAASQAEVDARVNASVTKAVADIEKKYADLRSEDVRKVNSTLDYLERQVSTLYLNASRVGGD